MKKLMTMGAVAMMAAAVFAEVKIGTVDMMLLVRNHPSYETNKALLTSTESDYQKQMDGMKSELESIQDEGKKLADEYRNPMLAQAEKDKLEKKLQEVQTRFMKQQQALRNEAMRNQQNLSDLEARLLKAQAADLKKRIANYAEKEGIDIVMDASAALYSKKSFDVTDAILKDMGVDPKAAKAKEKDESK